MWPEPCLHGGIHAKTIFDCSFCATRKIPEKSERERRIEHQFFECIEHSDLGDSLCPSNRWFSWCSTGKWWKRPFSLDPMWLTDRSPGMTAVSYPPSMSSSRPAREKGDETIFGGFDQGVSGCHCPWVSRTEQNMHFRNICSAFSFACTRRYENPYIFVLSEYRMKRRLLTMSPMYRLVNIWIKL